MHIYIQRLKTKATSEKVMKFMEYVNRQWITSNTFTLDALSVYGLSIRTNNDCEGYHNRMRIKCRGNQQLYSLAAFLFKKSKIVATNITLVI